MRVLWLATHFHWLFCLIQVSVKRAPRVRLPLGSASFAVHARDDAGVAVEASLHSLVVHVVGLGRRVRHGVQILGFVHQRAVVIHVNKRVIEKRSEGSTGCVPFRPGSRSVRAG